jgi:hypothetical protein
MPDQACSEEVAAAILEILQTAILSIRFASWRGDSRYAAIEADHIHNLPDLMRRYHPDRLAYYLNVERPSYIAQLRELPGSNVDVYTPQWAALEQALAIEQGN